MSAVTLPGTGEKVAVDTIATEQHQLVKMEFGAAGAATQVSASNPLPVTVNNFPATQPVSAANLPLPAGAATDLGLANIFARLADGSQVTLVSGTVGVSNFPASQAVTGTFWQSTQPVSIAATVVVSGTFWQATQPVSIASMPSTPVTGTFWQATQPVSGTVGVNNFPASQAVTGTFFQATQPVSIASMPSTPVTGTFWQATQPVSSTQLPAALAAGGGLKVEGIVGGVAQPVSGTVTATQGTAAALSGAWPAKLTDGTTAVKVTVGNAQPGATDGALLVNAIDTFAGTALASASRGVATVNTDIVNYNGKGIRVWQDLTVLGASSVCTFSIQEKDPVSGKFITLLASAATGAGINATGTAKLTVYPGLTAAANSVASDVVPVNIRIVSTVATAASTFSIGYSLIP